MKKTLCLVVILVVLITIVFPNIISAKSFNDISDQAIIEEKRLCTATINDDFVNDEIIVILNNESSRNLHNYTKLDFNEISAVSVENITQYTTELLETQRKQNLNQIKDYTNGISTVDEVIINEDDFHQIWLIKLDKKSKSNVLKSIKLLENREDILSVSPNYYHYKDEMDYMLESVVDESLATLDEKNASNDNYVSKQESLNIINLQSAWNKQTQRTKVRVGVIDTGIQGDHPDLESIVNSDLSENFSGEGNELDDPDGHGTFVAGIIGAINNNIGINGVCRDVELISLKTAYYVEDKKDYYSDSSKLYKAINYAIANNISVLNYSYSSSYNSTEVKDALLDYDGVLVCSAGNEGINITQTKRYPGCFGLDNVICVANSNDDDEFVTSSNYSPQYVDLTAPGVGIYSTYINSDYKQKGGTSYASPHVAGVAALLKSEYPDISGKTIKYYITEGVDEIDTFEDKVATGGRLNAFNALNGVKTFKVRYDANGGTGTMSDTTVIYNNITHLSANQFTYSGAVFGGWCAYRESDQKWLYTNGTSNAWYEEGSQKSGYYKYEYRDLQTLAKTSSVDNDTIVMQAQWDYDVEINFNANTGTGAMDSITADFTKTTNLPNNIFSKSGYRFDHWYVKNEAGKTLCYSGPEYAWYDLSELPYGYYREKISNGGEINKNIITETENGDCITLYAYWEPENTTLGDVDKNGYVGYSDVTLVQNYLSNATSLTAEQRLIADVNYSNSVTIKDATLIQKYVRGEIKYFID